MAEAHQAVTSAYEDAIATGAIEDDVNQRRVVAALDALRERLIQSEVGREGGFFDRLFGSRAQDELVEGLYIWGSVGRGKTMLMDMFFDSVSMPQKRRVHFHAFMNEVHGKIYTWRNKKKENQVRGDDPIAPVAEDLAEKAKLLCFDEFSVTDITDAMILGRLFTAMFRHGVVVVATSNVEPSRLYENGLNRALFLPFIKLLHQHVEVVELDARTDFRLEKLRGSPVYVTPADEDAVQTLDALFLKMTGKKKGSPFTLTILGRTLIVPQAAGNVARFDFADVCEKPLASADYLAIAERFHTIFIDAIPQFALHQRNEAKRFINLIDTLYDQRVKLVVSAAGDPQELNVSLEGKEAFEFERTSSRLIEMQSADYLALPHGRNDAVLPGSAAGIVET